MSEMETEHESLGVLFGLYAIVIKLAVAVVLFKAAGFLGIFLFVILQGVFLAEGRVKERRRTAVAKSTSQMPMQEN